MPMFSILIILIGFSGRFGSKTVSTLLAPIVPATATIIEPQTTEQLPAPPQTLRTKEERSLSKQNISDVLDNVRKLLKGISEKPTNAGQKLSIDRIESLARLSEQALARDDLRQADRFARRALTLARNLKQSR